VAYNLIISLFVLMSLIGLAAAMWLFVRAETADGQGGDQGRPR